MNGNQQKKSVIISAILFLVCLVTAIIFSLPSLALTEDKTVNALLFATVPRLASGIFIISAMSAAGFSFLLKINTDSFLRSLLWCVPCFLVAIVNFPFSALIKGSATVVRTDLIWLLALKCLAISLMEESLFRGVILPTLNLKLNCKHKILITVILSSALFALTHLINLFFGYGLGATALQVGYSFLLGCMLAVILLKTKNLWLCVTVHALFDFGGLIITDLGYGNFHDLAFWILTAIAAALCTAHVIITLVKVKEL